KKPLSRWDMRHMKNNRKIEYARTFESAKWLEKHNLIQVVEIKESSKNVKMNVYGPTFKGMIKYLSKYQLPKPKTDLNTGESNRELEIKNDKKYNAYGKQIKDLNNILENLGDKVNFPIFKEIIWLENNYGLIVLDVLLKTSRKVQSGSVEFLSSTTSDYLKQANELKSTLKLIEKFPDHISKTVNVDNTVVLEKDLLIDTLKNSLISVENMLHAANKGENEALKNAFAFSFLESLALIERRKFIPNIIFAGFTKDMLEKRMKCSVAPLEKIIQQLESTQ
ncbi:MAG: hypothetical protein GX587_05480, partial [Bacteroidales bacterium]|nr:hypothetical protein [Bacteroidales bacterium]